MCLSGSYTCGRQTDSIYTHILFIYIYSNSGVHGLTFFFLAFVMSVKKVIMNGSVSKVLYNILCIFTYLPKGDQSRKCIKIITFNKNKKVPG